MITPAVMPVLPAELRYPLEQGYQFARGEGRRMPTPDAGPPIAGPRRTLVADRVQLTLQLSRAERAIFDRFYLDDLKRGIWPFAMPDPETDGWPMLDENFGLMLDDEGEPILLDEIWVAMIGTPPVSSAVPNSSGTYSRVSFDLWIMP